MAQNISIAWPVLDWTANFREWHNMQLKLRSPNFWFGSTNDILIKKNILPDQRKKLGEKLIWVLNTYLHTNLKRKRYFIYLRGLAEKFVYQSRGNLLLWVWFLPYLRHSHKWFPPVGHAPLRKPITFIVSLFIQRQFSNQLGGFILLGLFRGHSLAQQ